VNRDKPERLNLRIAREADAGEMLRIYAPLVRETAISFELNPPSVEELRERIRNILSTHVWLVCDEGQALVGYAYASRFRPREAYQWTAEVTVYVHSAHQRRGIGRALYLSLLELLRLQGFSSAIGVIALPNEASVQLHERLGFEAIGVFKRAGYKLGRWHDVGWWHLDLRNYATNPNPPRSVTELVGSPEWERALATGLTGEAGRGVRA